MPPRVNPRVPAEGAQAPNIAAILANLANSMADMATQVAATNVTVNNLANQVAAVNPNVNATPVFALSPGRAHEDVSSTTKPNKATKSTNKPGLSYRPNLV